MYLVKPTIKKSLISLLFLTAFSSSAIEVTPYIGQIYANDFISQNDEVLAVEASKNFALGISWKDGPNGQGQFLFTSANHDFETNSGGVGEIDIIYAHFNGIAHFRQHNYITTVSIGLGGAYYDVKDGKDDLFPSFTAALGTRYQIDKNLAVVTELRSFVTLTDDESDILCPNSVCLAEFENALWIQTSISLGVSYQF
ncbi:MAG: hypothetical protein ACSHW0_17545 [Thalassotalea sp.]